MKVRRKSRWRSENLRRHLRRRANQRAAKERLRRERAAAEPEIQAPEPNWPKPRPAGFRITVHCLEDGARASFTAHRLPWGLSISPSLAGRKVAAVLRHYAPACPSMLIHGVSRA